MVSRRLNLAIRRLDLASRKLNSASREVNLASGKLSPLDVQLSEEMLKEWQTCHKTNLSYLAKDRSAVYGGFHLYEKVSLRTSSSEISSLVETEAPKDVETVAFGN